MREIRTYGSEGGGGNSRSLPLSEDEDYERTWRTALRREVRDRRLSVRQDCCSGADR
jgi:hypothetical protein